MPAPLTCEDCPHMMGDSIVGALCVGPRLPHPRIIDADYPVLEKDVVDYTTPEWCPLEDEP